MLKYLCVPAILTILCSGPLFAQRNAALEGETTRSSPRNRDVAADDGDEASNAIAEEVPESGSLPAWRMRNGDILRATMVRKTGRYVRMQLASGKVELFQTKDFDRGTRYYGPIDTEDASEAEVSEYLAQRDKAVGQMIAYENRMRKQQMLLAAQRSRSMRGSYSRGPRIRKPCGPGG